MTKIKLVAFDWNGTVLSDTKQVLEAEIAVMNHFGLLGHNKKRQQDHYQIPIKEYWRVLGFDMKKYDLIAEDIYRIFTKNYTSAENRARSRSGIREVTAWLHKNGLKAIIFSNHEVSRINNQLIRLKLEKFFDEILARSEGDNSHLHNRSKGAKLQMYQKKYKYKSSEIITVGDTIEEIEIAQKQGYISIAISGGVHSTKRLRAAKPDYLINNLKDLKNIIQKINAGTTQRN
jgi:phosphoglycolate phosphatase